MTTPEIAAVIGVGMAVVVNVAVLVWGASKMSSKVDQVNSGLREMNKDFKEFAIEHKNLVQLVAKHSTAIALIAQAGDVKIRATDTEEGLGNVKG